MVTAEDRATVFSAGHPLRLRRRGDAVDSVGAPSPMLGFVDDYRVQGIEVEIRPGDLLLLYTDGVLDTVGEAGRFGEPRLRETIRSFALDEDADLSAAVIGALESFLQGTQRDDIAMLSLARLELAVGAWPAERAA